MALLTQCTQGNRLSKRKAITKIYLLNKLSMFISVFFHSMMSIKRTEKLMQHTFKNVSCVQSVQYFLNLISSLSVSFLGVPLCVNSQMKESLVYFVCTVALTG